jgi:colanic acid/amylovoran biosynthesis protein
VNKNILVVGANFGNKGAQSMLFITVDEIKKRAPDCNVYFASDETFDDSLYKFEWLYYSNESKQVALAPDSIHSKYIKCKRWAKDVIKFILGRRINLFKVNDTGSLFPKIDFVVDVSGFSIGSKWSVEDQEYYLNNIRLAKKYNIPIVMMPQSFGDFHYSKDQEYLLPQIEKLFKYPKIIFAREKEGYQALTEEFHLENVCLSTDLVLQNTGIDLNNIYFRIPDANVPKVERNAVAIIPNKQCFNHGDEEKNLNVYKELISHLITKGKKVYLFRHSKEDLEICRMIAEQFGVGENNITNCGIRTVYKNGNIVVLDNDFSCLEYDEFVKNFDFVICSRFHGCVHAYRNYIPCILLGWAIKYQELAENVGQGQYAFDIASNDFSSDKVIVAVDNLIEHLNKESGIIKEHVVEIQKHNCFDQIEEWLR